jgi:hypothetical protein
MAFRRMVWHKAQKFVDHPIWRATTELAGILE